MACGWTAVSLETLRRSFSASLQEQRDCIARILAIVVVAFLALIPARAFAAGPNFVYTNNDVAGTNTVSGFSVAGDGSLTAVTGSPFSQLNATGNGVGYYASNRIVIYGTLLFASNAVSNNISVFTIDPNSGSLTPVAGSPFATGGTGVIGGGGGISLAITPNGQFLFAGNAGSQNISAFSVSSGGVLSSTVSGSPFPAGGLTPDGMKVSPDGQFLVMGLPLTSAPAEADNNTVGVFSIGVNGALTAVTGSPFAKSPCTGCQSAGVDISAAGNVFAGTNNAFQVDVFNVAGNGALSLIGSPFTNGIGTDSNVVLLSPNQQFLFVSDQQADAITSFSVASGGSLSVVGTVPTSGSLPAGMDTDVLGDFLYAAGSGVVHVFSIAGNGALTQVPSSPTSTGQGDGLHSLAAFVAFLPTITITTPANGSTYQPFQAVASSYTCVDASDPVATCNGPVANGSNIDTSTTGSNTFTVTATDTKGSSASSSTTYSVAFQPTITITTPANGAGYTIGEIVQANYSCTDADDPVTACSGPVANGANIDTTFGPKTFTVTATDSHGNTSMASVNYNVVHPPSIAISSPTNNAVYQPFQAVAASYSCTDVDDPVASCVGTVPSGTDIDTSLVSNAPLGPRAFTVNAVDSYGNASSRTFHYSVAFLPTITITVPQSTSYLWSPDIIGPIANYSCSDPIDPVVSCVGPVPDGSNIDISYPGTKTFTVVATDAHGNTASSTVMYDVVFPNPPFFQGTPNPQQTPGPSGSQVIISPQRLSFDPVPVGGTSSPHIVEVSNNNAVALHVMSVLSNATAFAESDNCVGTIPPHGSCSISVVFSPTVTGTQSGALKLTDDISLGAQAAQYPQSVALMGTGTGSTQPVIAVPDAISFAPQPVNTMSGLRTVSVTNRQSAALHISGISVAGQFVQASNTCGGVLAPKSSCAIAVVFAPTSSGEQTGAITISHDAASTPLKVSLSGAAPMATPVPTPTAVVKATPPPTPPPKATASPKPTPAPQPTITVTITPTPIATPIPSPTPVSATLRVTPRLLNLGRISMEHRAGQAASVRKVVLSNPKGQSATITIGSIAADGDFAVPPGVCVGALAPGKKCVVTVSFVPTGAGHKTGSLTIESDAENGIETVTLSGTAVK